jgi:acetate kinase
MADTELCMTMNAGSSTIKIGLFDFGRGQLRRISKCEIDLRHAPLRLLMEHRGETIALDIKTPLTEDLHAVIDAILSTLSIHFPIELLRVVGHRVVHGSQEFIGPILLDHEAISRIAKLIPLAPLHQPQALRIIEAIAQLRPHLAQTASFDTAFHHSQSDLVRRFALPRTLSEQGIKRYGFHGLSYKFIASELSRSAPDIAAKKVIVAHLGSGASLCALEGGMSRDCSMSFSTLDGIPMATRPGSLDPGVLLYMLGPLGMPLAEVEDMLYNKSGLLGVSGISADTRALLKDPRPEAREAIDLFTLRIAGEAGRMTATLGGLDAIVFTAGIGEHQPEIRAAIARRLEWLGLTIDPAANEANAAVISTSDSRVTALVIPTNEERVIAEDALAAIQKP